MYATWKASNANHIWLCKCIYSIERLFTILKILKFFTFDLKLKRFLIFIYIIFLIRLYQIIKIFCRGISNWYEVRRQRCEYIFWGIYIVHILQKNKGMLRTALISRQYLSYGKATKLYPFCSPIFVTNILYIYICVLV